MPDDELQSLPASEDTPSLPSFTSQEQETLRHTSVSAAESVLAVIGKRLAVKRREDEYDVVGKNVALKLRKMNPNMQIIAEYLINDILYKGLTETLQPH